MTYELDAYPSAPVCSGGALLETYGGQTFSSVAPQRTTVYFHSPNVPTSTLAVLLVGTGMPAMSNGLCLGGVARVPNSTQQASALGEYTFGINTQQYLPGTTNSFQLWYRIPDGSEFSDAIEVTFM